MSDVIELFPTKGQCVTTEGIHLCAGKLRVLRTASGAIGIAVHDATQQAGFYKAFATRGELDRFIAALTGIANRMEP